MDVSDKSFSELYSNEKNSVNWRSDPALLSKDFWMPDHSCRVCYDCDSQFNIINRRHHCRLCGRVFCGKCTNNFIQAPGSESKASLEELDRVRVCSYCFKQWTNSISNADYGVQVGDHEHSTSPSAASFISSKSTSTTVSGSNSLGSMSHPVEQDHHVQRSSNLSSDFPYNGKKDLDWETMVPSRRSNDYDVDRRVPSQSWMDDDDDDCTAYQSDSKTGFYPQVTNYDDRTNFDELNNPRCSCEGNKIDANRPSSSPLSHSLESHGSNGVPQQLDKKDDESLNSDECVAPSSIFSSDDIPTEPLDFDKHGTLWLPPEPENEEDETEDLFLGDEDEGEGSGEWGYLHKSGSFGSGEYRNRDRCVEEHMMAMKDVVFSHFRALVSQLLYVENLPMDGENNEENWIDIITSLSWEAATLLKPDRSTSGGMDPGGYVKVKCIASGQRRDSMVVGGVVCKKNVAHRRMTSKIEKPRILILGGALEYQRVSNLLSSFDTLLQQEMDHLKMAVAKIDSHNPDVLLVENSVSRYAQDYLLAKDISLVLNIKRPLLERIARCTGAQIAPSVDHMSSPKLGNCDKFHVKRFLEEHGTAGHGGKKLTKTLMYFEGCPKPLGFTILLRGGNGDELKKVKRVVQYGVFAAYHLALETSFLADERASLPELPLKSPITVALPDKSLSIERSISTVPGFIVPNGKKSLGAEPASEARRANSLPAPEISMQPSLSDNPKNPSSQYINQIASLSSSTSMKAVSDFCHNMLLSYDASEKNERTCSKDNEVPTYVPGQSEQIHQPAANSFELPGAVDEVVLSNVPHNASNGIVPEQVKNVDGAAKRQESKTAADELGPLKEEFPPSPSDHQSILVSLSSRCVWKGTVCERSHLFRIKYYGSFDKPLGRFLRDNLLDQGPPCSSCEMPSEAHVHCYTHRQGSLTISVRKLSEFVLPGEKDGKIWMWHRCLQCPRVDGFPPATRRVVMSDAAWGLSFGKFLELSFSNHAAASRVASCGHSLHRDCLRFYGFGNMVACFRYASIDVLSVYVPPAKVEFSYEYQDWIKKEVDEVVNRAELLFSEVLNALSQIAEERHGSGNSNGHELRRRLAELEQLLHKEKMEFEESLQKTLNREATKEKPAVDILEINRLCRQLLFQSIMWDHRLVFVASVDSSLQNGFKNILSENKETILPTSEIPCEEYLPVGPGTKTTSSGFLPDDAKLDDGKVQDKQVDMVHSETKCGETRDLGEDKQAKLSASTNMYDHCDSLDLGANVHRALSEGQFPLMKDLSETLDAKWIGETQPGVAAKGDDSHLLSSVSTDSSKGDSRGSDRDGNVDDLNGLKVVNSFSSTTSGKASNGTEDSVSWLGIPFMSLYRSLSKSIVTGSQKMELLGQYNPVYISSLQESGLQGGARLLLPVGINDTVIPVFDDEPTSMISYALSSSDYHMQLLDEAEKMRDSESAVSFLSSDSSSVNLLQSFDEMISESHRSFGSLDESISSMSGPRSSLALDPVSYTKALHAKVSFVDDSHLGKLKFSVTCYYAKRFEALRRICCPSELDFIRSLSRCKKWRAQGGKSNAFFAKTLDDRFIIKQVTKTELEAFIKFAPSYFKYLSESIACRSPTSLAKILGIYQVSLKGVKESKIDVLVMENLLFGRDVTRLYDLKGSTRSRYNADSTGKNKVLLDQNLIELMSTSPMFVGNKAKRLLERAVWNDTSFLASVDVMDYSLLVGVDKEKHELVLGIIDYMRQYTWDKHLETWVKASGILGGPRNVSPTVISPVQYKKRFRKAMTTYFLMVPDQWSPPNLIPSRSQSDLQEEDAQNGTSVEQ